MKKLVLLSILLGGLNVFCLQAEEKVLKNTQNWTIDSISSGLIWYKFEAKYKNIAQVVNVLEVDIKYPEYKLKVTYTTSRDSLSSISEKQNAVAGINGGYELDATFIKENGTIRSQVSRDIQKETHLRHWKHEGAFFYDDNTRNFDIQYGTNNDYYASSCPNILSAAPVLIYNNSPVGETFIGDVTGINLNSLEYEDYRRHQGVRHPRTAIAYTETGKVLMITVDGRQSGKAEGMKAAELTQFLTEYFNPKSALNLDGGGSTSMYIKDKKGVKNNDIVNCPIDSDIKYKQRLLSSFVLVMEEKLSSVTSVEDDMLDVHIEDKVVFLKSDKTISQIKLYTLQGQELSVAPTYSKAISFPVPQSGVLILSVLCDSQWRAVKLIVK